MTFQVMKVISHTEFLVFHEDFKLQFLIKQTKAKEDHTAWLNCVTHSNIVTCFDSFAINDDTLHFVMTETYNGGRLLQEIERRNLNLAEEVPKSYVEFVYEVAI